MTTFNQGETLRRIDLNLQEIFDSGGNFIGFVNPVSGGDDFRPVRFTHDGTALVGGSGGQTYQIVNTYTWAALQAMTGMVNGTRAYVSDLGNVEFIYDSAQSAWVRNASFIMAAFAIPMVLPPTGSVGANGALTLGGTGIISYAGAAGYATDCYMYFAAGAVASGSPAGFYYTKMSSATGGVIYNNRYSAPRFGRPAIPATPTAIVDAGPGAYTGVTTAVSLFDIVVPAKLLGPHGQIRCAFTVDTKNTAGSKTLGAGFGGISTFFSAIANSQGYGFITTTRNVNSRSKQVTMYGGYGDVGSAGQNTYTSSVDSTVDQDYVVSAQMAAATDYVVLTGLTLEILCS